MNDKYEKIREISVNQHHAERYINFIHSCIENNKSGITEFSEKHHFLPRSLFPDYVHDPENIIRLTGRQHFLCHWMLAKATDSHKMWFAFNQMRRICNDEYQSILYQYAREKISQIISESNTGRKMLPHVRENLSKVHKNTVCVRDYTGNKFRVNCDDPRIDSRELTIDQFGRTHTYETKQKMSENGIRGKTAYVGPKGDVKYFTEEEIPEGYVKVHNPLNISGEQLMESFWAHNPVTGEQKRLKKDESLPHGFKIGRNPEKHRGFDHINSSGQKTILDLVDKKYKLVEKINPQYQIHFYGHSISSIYVYIHNNSVIVASGNMIKYMYKHFGALLKQLDFCDMDKPISKPHHNNNKENYQFRSKYYGYSMHDLGFKKYKLEDFTFDPHIHTIEHLDGVLNEK